MNEVAKEIGNIHLTRGDMQTLNDGRWLNDQVYYTYICYNNIVDLILPNNLFTNSRTIADTSVTEVTITFFSLLTSFYCYLKTSLFQLQLLVNV